MKKIALGVAIAALTPVAMAAPTTEEMWETIKQQQQEIERLKAKSKETDARVEATADAVERGGNGGWASRTTLGGYGEHHFNHFDDGDDAVDAHRFVLFVGHQYSDTIRFFSELEVEHGLTKDTNCNGVTPVAGTPLDCGSDGPGEVELEQAYIQWDFVQGHSLTVGQFLVPVGILNETHEPDTFYGTERNSVESAIVPATWWETGAMVGGEILPGLSYNVAVHSGLKTADGGAVRGGRQKSAKATAEDLAFTGRLKYTGIAGLELAATVQQQQSITQGAGVGDNEATLLEAHARYNIGNLTLTALTAEWDIDGATFEGNGRDQQEGAYLEASYKITPKLGVFVRQVERDNNAGETTVSGDTEIKEIAGGINYWLHERVVLKADWIDSDADEDGRTATKADSFNLGVGWSF